ncbi:MAG: type II toxin-antitoxin system RelE/ParE family toxin [Caldilineaceae bacterium]|nr:type II toxin-antitoxin system RelE/ParE family toxin [Caldilineaceae bacterium]MBP8106359.1 type II toxin-antitoxin system RelE/ParE family toxin [Caldilineaceae bacterium]MBP8121458.1 type II toxin-antitoxin system RelE/ParE family toxin [Caldilineaceae bacterium]MBP9073713.1 type II toxin-antitoxin system RelE/ParE family toxin [Caldilineaceae bacterium]
MAHVVFTPTAEDDLARLNKPVAQRVFSKIRWLADNFQTLTPLPLTGQWEGVYKLRVGDYRVLYTFDTSQTSITIHFVRHRREVYKIK